MSQSKMLDLIERLAHCTDEVQGLIRKHALPGSHGWTIPAPERPKTGERKQRIEVEPVAIEEHLIVETMAQFVGLMYFRQGQDWLTADRMPGVLIMPVHTRPAFEALNEAKSKLRTFVEKVNENEGRRVLSEWQPPSFNRQYAMRHIHLAHPGTVKVQFSWRRSQSKWESLPDRAAALEWADRNWPASVPRDQLQSVANELAGTPQGAHYVIRHPRPPEPVVRWSIKDPEKPSRMQRVGEQRASVPLVCFDQAPAVNELKPTHISDLGFRDQFGHQVPVKAPRGRVYHPVVADLNLYYYTGG